MKKIVVNQCYGGFSLSHAGCMKYAELAGFTLYYFYDESEKEHYGENPDPNKVRPSYTKEQVESWDGVTDENYFYSRNLERDDPVLVRVVEILGTEANGSHAALAITEVPNDVNWQIGEYDGQEWVEEVHRRW